MLTQLSTKLLHNLLKASINRFVIYHPHYKNKFSNLTWSFVFTTYYLHSLYSLSHLSAAFVCATKESFVTKRKKPPKTSLYLFFYSFQTLSFFFRSILSKYVIILKWQSNLRFSKMRLANPKYSTIFKVAAISKYNTLSK